MTSRGGQDLWGSRWLRGKRVVGGGGCYPAQIVRIPRSTTIFGYACCVVVFFIRDVRACVKLNGNQARWITHTPAAATAAQVKTNKRIRVARGGHARIMS